jgi:hypothetical protein
MRRIRADLFLETIRPMDQQHATGVDVRQQHSAEAARLVSSCLLVPCTEASRSCGQNDSASAVLRELETRQMVLEAARDSKFVPEGGGGFKLEVIHGVDDGSSFPLMATPPKRSVPTVTWGKIPDRAHVEKAKTEPRLPLSCGVAWDPPLDRVATSSRRCSCRCGSPLRSFPSEPRAGAGPGSPQAGRTSSVPPTPAGDGQTRKMIRRKTRFRVFSTPIDVGEPTPTEIARRGAPRSIAASPLDLQVRPLGRVAWHSTSRTEEGSVSDPTKRTGPDHSGCPSPGDAALVCSPTRRSRPSRVPTTMMMMVTTPARLLLRRFLPPFLEHAVAAAWAPGKAGGPAPVPLML